MLMVVHRCAFADGGIETLGYVAASMVCVMALADDSW
jgi:hypothetical protein